MCQAAFRDLHLYKFLSFIYNHPNFSKGISQRTNTQLNEWCVLDAGGPLADCAKKKRTHTRGAVNLETHSRTIELRLFRGTLFEPSFWAKLEFSHALWRFTRDVSVPKANPTVFVETLDNWKKDYPHLHKFIADRPELRDYNQPPTNQPTRRNSNPYTHSERTV